MRPVEGTEFKPDQRIWRYMNRARFSDMLESNRIYFASANQFIDPFEGAVAVQPYDFPIDPRYSEMDHLERAFRELKRLTKISCWHIEEYESDAMWHLYAEQGKGVAIVSRPSKISASLTPYRIRPEYGVEELHGGNVKYVDLMKVRLQVRDLERFYHKHIAFSWEREFRCSISLRMAEEFGIRVPSGGIFVEADPKELIEEIHIGPGISPEGRQLVMQACQERGLHDRVHISSLIGRPRYV